MANSRREYFRKTRKKRMRDLKHSVTGWIGTVSALLAAVLFAASVGFSYYREGDAEVIVGSIGLIALVLAAGALVLGIFAVREEKVRPVPPRISLVLGIVMTAVLGGLYTYGFEESREHGLYMQHNKAESEEARWQTWHGAHRIRS